MNKNGEIIKSTELNCPGEAVRMNISFFCSNIPVGSHIAFSADKPDIHGNPVKMDKLEVPARSGSSSVLPHFQAGVTYELPTGYSATITYSCWPNGEIPPHFSMEIRCALFQ